MCQKSLSSFHGLDQFMKKYQLEHCQSARERINTKESGWKGEETNKSLAIIVMNITQKMIGSLDLLELNICEVDQVAPAIIDI